MRFPQTLVVVLVVATFIAPDATSQTTQEDACAAKAPTTPYAEAARVYVRVDNRLEAASLRVCLFDAEERLIKIIDRDVAAAGRTMLDLPVPSGELDIVVLAIDTSSQGATAVLKASDCKDASGAVHAFVDRSVATKSVSIAGTKCGGPAAFSTCDDALVPVTGATDVRIDFEIENRGLAGEVRLCLFDGAGQKRYMTVLAAESAAKLRHAVDLPGGDYTTDLSIKQGITSAFASHRINLTRCDQQRAELRYQFFRSATGVGAGQQPAVCNPIPNASAEPAPPTGTASSDRGDAAGLLEGDPDDPGALSQRVSDANKDERWTATFLTLAILTGASWTWPTTRYGWLILFSRLVKPRALEHATRAKIHELVRNDPGVHINQVSRILEIGNGEAHYHVAVLLRHKILVEARVDGRRCLFDAHDPLARRRMGAALLRRAREGQVYNAVRPDPANESQMWHATPAFPCRRHQRRFGNSNKPASCDASRNAAKCACS